MSKLKQKISLMGFLGLCIYIAFISWRLFFYAYSNNYRRTIDSISYNVKPFKTIINYMQNNYRVSPEVLIYNIAGNIAAFFPVGFLLPLAFKGLNYSS
jgi:glycopeptide antibiotics resistance protein